MSSPPSPAYSSSPNTSPSPPPLPPPGSPPAPQFQHPTIRPEELESRRGLMQAYRDSIERVAGMLGEHSQVEPHQVATHFEIEVVQEPPPPPAHHVAAHSEIEAAQEPPPQQIHAGISDEIEEVGEGEQLEQDGGPFSLEVDAPVVHQEANSDRLPHVPRYISCALDLILALMNFLTGYEPTVFGGASISLGFLHAVFPLLKYRENLFGENDYCSFYHHSTLLANCSFHMAAPVTIVLVQGFARTRARVLYLALAASCIHGVGTLMSATANGPVLLFVGRICSGFGIGIMMQTKDRISAIMESPNYKRTPGSKLLQRAATVVAAVAANSLNLRGLKHPDSYWRLSFGGPGVLSAIMALVSSLVLWLGRKNDSTPDMWSLPATDGTTVTRPLFFIEAVKTIITPLLDLNLYNHVLTMFLTPSDMVTYWLPTYVSLWQCFWLGVSDYLNYHLGVRVRWYVACGIVVAQGVTFVLVSRQDGGQIGKEIGITALVFQGLFIICYAHISSTSGWIDFPDDGVKKKSYILLAVSMIIQGVIAYWTPYLVCSTAAGIYGIWALAACFAVAFIYWFVPDIRNETTDELRAEKLRAYGAWSWILALF